MKNTTLILMLILSSLCFSQEIQKKLGYKITYNLTYKLDSTNLKKVYNEQMILFTLGEKSNFRSISTVLLDSIIDGGEKGTIDKSVAMKAVVNLPHSHFDFSILKDFSQNKIIVYDQVFTNVFRYEEPLLKNWQILSEIKTVSGYKCQKATTHYGGRDYIAWFTNEIGINDGPYKFSGLPGLIIAIADTRNHYSFSLIGIEKKLIEVSESFTHASVINTTKTKYFKALKDFNDNMAVRIQNNPNFNFGRTRIKKKLRNNPIELKIE